MAKTLNPDRLFTALVSIMEAKHNVQLSVEVKNPDGTVFGRYGSLSKPDSKK